MVLPVCGGLREGFPQNLLRDGVLGVGQAPGGLCGNAQRALQQQAAPPSKMADRRQWVGEKPCSGPFPLGSVVFEDTVSPQGCHS